MLRKESTDRLEALKTLRDEKLHHKKQAEDWQEVAGLHQENYLRVAAQADKLRKNIDELAAELKRPGFAQGGLVSDPDKIVMVGDTGRPETVPHPYWKVWEFQRGTWESTIEREAIKRPVGSYVVSPDDLRDITNNWLKQRIAKVIANKCMPVEAKKYIAETEINDDGSVTVTYYRKD